MDDSNRHPTHMVHRTYAEPVMSKPPHSAPSFEMLFLGFVLGVLVAVVLGATGLAPALGIAVAVLFGAADL